MTPTPLRLLLCAALGAFPAASLGQQLPEEVEPLPFGETITVDGTVSSVGAKSECWLFRPAGRTFIGADEFPIFSVIDLPEEFRQPVLRVTITGVFLLHSDRGCFSTREIVIQSVEMADGPQLRRDVYVRLSEAQSCLEGNDNNCAVAILDEIESTYELNAYEKWQLWNFKAFMYIGGDETSLGFHALEEILMLGDIT